VDGAGIIRDSVSQLSSSSPHGLVCDSCKGENYLQNLFVPYQLDNILIALNCRCDTTTVSQGESLEDSKFSCSSFV